MSRSTHTYVLPRPSQFGTCTYIYVHSVGSALILPDIRFRVATVWRTTMGIQVAASAYTLIRFEPPAEVTHALIPN